MVKTHFKPNPILHLCPKRNLNPQPIGLAIPFQQLLMSLDHILICKSIIM